MRPWVIVAGDFVRTGGMDAANRALAEHLAARGEPVHLVAHRVEAGLAAMPGVRVHRVPRPLGSHLLGFPLLDRAGRRVARALRGARPRVVASGGNCRAGEAVWLHYVHAAYAPEVRGGPVRRMRAALARRLALAQERAAAGRARVVVANSALTGRHAVERLGAPGARVRVIRYGTDPARFRPPGADERAGVRAALGWAGDRPVACFVGALGDRRKGFDTLFAAWTRLCESPAWDARLAVLGAGGELAAWRRRAERAGLDDRIEFLGFQPDVRRALWAADLLVAPTRYEAYGLAVHEAACCGVPALVSAGAGVAEVLSASPELRLADPDDAGELATRLAAWRGALARHRAAALEEASRLRRRSWDRMAAEIAEAVREALP